MPVVEHELPAREMRNQQHTVAPMHKWYNCSPSTKEEREEIEKFFRWRFPERYDSAVLED